MSDMGMLITGITGIISEITGIPFQILFLFLKKLYLMFKIYGLLRKKFSDGSRRTAGNQFTYLRKRKIKTSQIFDPVNDMKLMKCKITISALFINICRRDQTVVRVITQSLNGDTGNL